MRDSPGSLMIFAAGFGKRMGHLTAHRPKPLVEVGGKTLLDHAIEIGREAGVERIVVNAHYLAHMIEDHVAETGVLVSREEPEILDTGGGLRAALPLLGPGPVYVMNSDAVWSGPNPLLALSDGWRSEMSALLALMPSDRAVGHRGKGDFSLREGRLSRGGSYVYTGAQILDPGRLDEIGDKAFSLNRYWDLLAAEGSIGGTVYSGTWCDVGSPEGLDAAERLLAGRPG